MFENLKAFIRHGKQANDFKKKQNQQPRQIQQNNYQQTLNNQEVFQKTPFKLNVITKTTKYSCIHPYITHRIRNQRIRTTKILISTKIINTNLLKNNKISIMHMANLIPPSTIQIPTIIC